MSIKVGNTVVAKNDIVARFTNFFPNLAPRVYSIDTIVSRFETNNRTFTDFTKLREAIAQDIWLRGALINLDTHMFTKTSTLGMGQMKDMVVKGKIGNFNVVKLEVKGFKKKLDLAKEARLLWTLRQGNVRSVPIFGMSQIASKGVMWQRFIKGNFLDIQKEGFTERVYWNLIASLLGIEGCNQEHCPFSMLEKTQQAIAKKLLLGIYPTMAALNTSLHDFDAILTFLKTKYISDLQGIIEFNTGKFYIMDPLEIGSWTGTGGTAETLEKNAEQTVRMLREKIQTFKRYVELWTKRNLNFDMESTQQILRRY